MSSSYVEGLNLAEPTPAEHYQWLAERAGQLISEHELLDSHPREQATNTAAALVEISERAHAEAKDLLLDNIERGYMTRRKASEIMKVHEHTISRWLLAREVQTSEAS